MSELQEGPPSAWGYDGQFHPERPTPSEWRAFWMRKARKLGTHAKSDWVELRDRIGKCVACGRTDIRLSKDHIIPVSRGGCDCIHNLQPLCDSCNSSKGNR